MTRTKPSKIYRFSPTVHVGPKICARITKEYQVTNNNKLITHGNQMQKHAPEEFNKLEKYQTSNNYKVN